MDDTKPTPESNEPGLNKIDLSQLQDFTFGTQWTEVRPVGPGGGPRRERDSDRRDDAQGRGGPRDRRGFRRPSGPPSGAGGEGAPAGERPPRPGDFRGGPRRDFPPGERREFRGERRDFSPGERREFRGERGAPVERGPYVSLHFTCTCYPEDVGFAAMVKAVRASCRTFQLFEITKAVLEKNDRFVVVVQRKAPEAGPGTEAAAKPGPLFMSLPDHLPFDTEEAAVQHVLKHHLGQFFEAQEVEIDPPKGNFPIINKCGTTGELLGPPNYHKYQQILQQHHATRLGRMPFERFRESIVSVREPEVVQQWLDKMKKATRYTWKPPAVRPADTKAAAAPEATPAAEVPSLEPAPVPVPEAPPAPSFDSFEEARAHLLSTARDKVVRAVDSVRFHAKNVEQLPPGEIRRAVEGHIERQRRFPLDTANALRGRLRREGFTIFKKGSRGVSYVCAVKRRFRVPGQVFSESIAALIGYIEQNPMLHLKDLPGKFLGIDIPAPAPSPENATQSQAPFAALAPEQADRLRKMNHDLRWLVMEGYVTEFSDGKLFAPPPVAPHAAKKADEHGEEHDPVDFPEAPAAEAPAAEAPAAETPAAEAPAAEAPVESQSAAAPVETPAVASPDPSVEVQTPAKEKSEPTPGT